MPCFLAYVFDLMKQLYGSPPLRIRMDKTSVEQHFDKLAATVLSVKSIQNCRWNLSDPAT